VPLTYRDKGTSGTQIDVRSGNLSVAHIGKEMFSQLVAGGARWRWNFSIGNGPPGFERHGHADTFEEAKAAVERNWQEGRTAAGLRDETT
jgi:hypothetical protein